MGWNEIQAWLSNAAKTAAGVVSPPAHSPGAVGVAGIRSMLPGSRSFDQELEAYNRDAAPSPLYSPTSRFGSVVTDPAKPLEPSGGERERQMQMAMQMPMLGPTAYHGSPHVFDKFSSAKIGTGEGAQAYGHGLYFTSEPKVAEGYRDALSKAVAKVNLPEPELAKEVGKRLRARAATLREQGFAASARSAEDAGLRYSSAPTINVDYLPTMERVHGIDLSDLVERQPGSFHQVDIPDNLLDFEKPLRDQPEPILSKLREVSADPQSPVGALAASGNIFDRTDFTGHDFYRALGQNESVRRRMAASRDAARALSSNPEAIGSEVLRELGIPGHSYVGDSSGAKNFVVYDDAVIQPKGRWSSLQEFLRSQEKAP